MCLGSPSQTPKKVAQAKKKGKASEQAVEPEAEASGSAPPKKKAKASEPTVQSEAEASEPIYECIFERMLQQSAEARASATEGGEMRLLRTEVTIQLSNFCIKDQGVRAAGVKPPLGQVTMTLPFLSNTQALSRGDVLYYNATPET